MPDGALERLSKKLDAGAADDEIKRVPLYPKNTGAPHDWPHEEAPPATGIFMAQRKRFSGFEILFMASAVFFVVAIGIAGFLFVTGSNTVSTKNVDIQVTGPTQIAAGDTLNLQVVITNRNSVPINLADLVMQFPSGTRSDLNVAISLPSIRESLGTINPGESVNRTIKAVLFGKADTDASIKTSVEYHVPSSNAVFVSATEYTTRISQSPASITVETNKEVVSGQDTIIKATLTSNSPQILKGMLLTATYPPGFSFTSADPNPVQGSALWNLGDIEPGGTRTITIHGIFSGEQGDAKVVNFTAGNQKSDNPNQIAAPLATGEADLTVTKPFISTSIALNGSVAEEHIIARGARVEGEIEWTNNLPVAVQNLSIVVSVKGQILDQTTLIVPRGFYSSSSGTMVWDKTTDGNLAEVAPGATQTYPFTFSTLPSTKGAFRNPEIDFVVTVKASRSTEGNVPEIVNATAATKALVASDLTFAAALSRTSGPQPPKVNTESIYTVTWTLTNSANALANVAATAALPNYARYVGNISPAGQQVVFDDKQGVITWTVGGLSAGETRVVSFQVGVTPSISQVGGTASVIQSQHASGFDRFIQDTVQASAPSLDTASGASSILQGLVVP
jgi:hypothetical protein